MLDTIDAPTLASYRAAALADDEGLALAEAMRAPTPAIIGSPDAPPTTRSYKTVSIR
jgi:hypothetical protein